MTGFPNSQNLNIYATGFFNFLFILLTVSLDILFGNCTVRNVDLFFRDINMVNKVLLHEPYIALKGIRLHREILVQIESDHILKAEILFFVKADQLII